jgi:hypothetical protein
MRRSLTTLFGLVVLGTFVVALASGCHTTRWAVSARYDGHYEAPPRYGYFVEYYEYRAPVHYGPAYYAPPPRYGAPPPVYPHSHRCDPW